MLNEIHFTLKKKRILKLEEKLIDEECIMIIIDVIKFIYINPRLIYQR